MPLLVVFSHLYIQLNLYCIYSFGSYKPEALPKQAHESSMLMLISPIILTSLVIVFGLFPGILTQSIIEPASEAVSQTSNITAEFHLFHGITPAFLSTIGIYIIGILLLISFSYWIRLLQAHPYQLTLNHWYDTSSRRIPGYSKI